MHIDMATEPGTPDRPNEDLALVTPGVLIVLDGVTPHPDGSGCVHDVPWYVARLGGAMLNAALTRPELPLADCLFEAIAGTAAAHAGTCELSHPRTPQSTVVAVRIGGARPEDSAHLEYLVLSDSTLLIDAGDPAPLVIADASLRQLPEPVPALRAEARSLPEGSPERAAARAAYVRAVEALRNAPGGFWTAAADPAAATHATTGRLPLNAVRNLALLTDGATRLVDVFKTTDWTQTMELLRRQGPEALLGEVRKAELADPAGLLTPRGKPMDDATAVLARLTEGAGSSCA
jgi:hypothetical protein